MRKAKEGVKLKEFNNRCEHCSWLHSASNCLSVEGISPSHRSLRLRISI